MQIIYHGSYCEVQEPEIREGKYSKDFGVGFYCTILEEQAIKWTKKYDTPIINKMAGAITREAFWELAKFRHPTHQIAFCTEKSLKCIKFIEAEKI